MDILYVIAFVIIAIFLYKKYIYCGKSDTEKFLDIEPLMTTNINNVIASNSPIINKSDGNLDTSELDKLLSAKLENIYPKLNENITLSDVEFRQIIKDELATIPGTILEIDKSAIISESVKSHIFNYFITQGENRYKYVIIAKVSVGEMLPRKIEITFQNVDYNKFIYVEPEPFYPFSLFTEFT